MKDSSNSYQIYSPVAQDKFGVLLISTARDAAIFGPFYDLQGLLVSFYSSLKDTRCYLSELIFVIEKGDN